MKLLRLSWRRGRQPSLPAWATETTTEAAIIQREADAVLTENRSRDWAQMNTGMLRTIRMGLEQIDDLEPSSEKLASHEWHTAA